MRLFEYFPIQIRIAINNLHLNINDMEEIRVRIGQPVFIKTNQGEYTLLDSDGNEVYADGALIDNLFGAINDFSLYAHSDNLKNGFITIEGGHRVGFVGQAVMNNDKMQTIKNISSINVRISHEVIGVSDKVINEIIKDGLVLSTLIIAPPGYGKTTLLRDIVRNISNGRVDFKGKNVTVIDERSEIASMYKGVPGICLGMRTDVFDSVPKKLGIVTALRTMAPDVIAVDEIGTYDDAVAIQQARYSGCSVIATIHGRNIKEIMNNPNIKNLLDYCCFDKYIVIEEGRRLSVYT